ncbi:avidin/streptavidin family protein [Kitasatospora sp. NPDC049258]|uniref:avidin/streptavidin family protein n=1 Tax=Kitasatospora sp. NPDC049258 TaxID=3155394 RepID=UPI00343153D9
MSIAGDWYNQFGSHMQLAVEPSGSVSGVYTSGTGHVVGSFEIAGRCRPAGRPELGSAVGWTVAWHNQETDEGSVTSWSGQYFEREQRIAAMWLLTRPASTADAWEATMVGQDVFTRQQP